MKAAVEKLIKQLENDAEKNRGFAERHRDLSKPVFDQPKSFYVNLRYAHGIEHVIAKLQRLIKQGD